MHSMLRGLNTRSLVLVAALFLAACEEPFEPIAPSDLVFSIYGHLDAGADTQWVRVMPLRESLLTEPGSVDAVVTLEELETGTIVQMSDSLSRYEVFLGNGEFYAHNFSTTLPMVPGKHYRLTATRSDGAAASVTVLIPFFESPTLVVSHTAGLLPYGTVRDTRYIGMVVSREEIPARCNLPYSVHQEFLPVVVPAAADGDDHRVLLAWPVDGPRPPFVQRPPPGCVLGAKRIIVVASPEPWPYDSSAEFRELSHPAAVDNIEGRGLGFVAGVHTHVFPYAVCFPLAGRSECAITFSPRSATLVGVVTNGCTGRPMDDVRVRLLGRPGDGTRIEITEELGAFQFQGLEPHVAYSLALSEVEAPGDFIPIEMGNIVLEEAAVDTMTIEMSHRRDCLA
jgi:hypothetical protein